MWLLGRLAPDHKTIADFRKDNGLALRKVCARFVELYREMTLLATASVAVMGYCSSGESGTIVSRSEPNLFRKGHVWLLKSVSQSASHLHVSRESEGGGKSDL